MKLSLPQLVDLARRHGFPDPELAAAVAMAESGGDSCSQGDPNIGYHPCGGPNGQSQSFGLWQVNIPSNPQYDAASLLDPDANANAAYVISSSGTNWRPWSTAWEDANRRVGYLGARAPFRPYYLHPVIDFPSVTPPTEPPSGAPLVLIAAFLAAGAGYVASERRRFV